MASDSSVLVAVNDDRIVAVGAVTDRGEMRLNYVAPEARLRGVSRAMLRALELRVRERGNSRITLLSTETARQFYRLAGYVEAGPRSCKFGTLAGYPMAKTLRPE